MFVFQRTEKIVSFHQSDGSHNVGKTAAYKRICLSESEDRRSPCRREVSFRQGKEGSRNQRFPLSRPASHCRNAGWQTAELMLLH